MPPEIQAGLRLLLRAYEYSLSAGKDAWQWAVEIEELNEFGLRSPDFRWLLRSGFAEHAKEFTIPSDTQRSFRKLPGTVLEPHTCFILTKSGAERLRQMLAQDCEHQPVGQETVAIVPASTSGRKPGVQPLPEWDARRRELRCGELLIKRFRVPAPNQERILAAFEEEGWPHQIDDPLPRETGIEPKRRLQATIKSLNRNQATELIRFHGNGTGTEVYWDLEDDTPITATAG